MAIAPSPSPRRAWLAIPAALVALIGAPLLLIGVGKSRLGSWSPLTGMDLPWRWTLDGLRRWGRSLSNGLETVDQLVDVFVRIGLVVAWCCVLVIAWTTVQEVVYQLRHGMPSASRSGGSIGWFGRAIANGLVALLPLSAVAAPVADAAHPGWRVGTAATLVTSDLATVVSSGSSSGQTVNADTGRQATAPDAANPGSFHVVAAGESMWTIAGRYAQDPDRIDAVAASIVAANAGRVMVDGHRFTTAALIEPGWHLQLPVGLASTSVTVQPGDSYWKLADQQLAATGEPSEAAVLELTNELIEHNASRLGYRNPAMLHPGDVVEFPSAEQPVTDPAAAPWPDDAPTPDELPVEDVPTPPLPQLDLPVDPNSNQPPTTSGGVETTPVSEPGPTVGADAQPSPPAAPDQALEPRAQTAPSSAPLDGDRQSSTGLPRSVGLAGAVALAAGVIAAVESRRRRRLRSLQIGQRLASPHPTVVTAERTLRAVSAAEQLARLDIAVRAVACDLADQQSAIAAAIVADDGAVTIVPVAAALPLDQRWMYDVDRGWWTLPAGVDVIELSRTARRSDQPCPALTHLGRSDLGNLFLDVEAVGVVAVCDCPDLVRAIAAALAVPPLGEDLRVLQHGVGLPDALGVERLESISDALHAIDTHSEAIAEVCTGSTTFAVRSRRQSVGDTAPLVVVAAMADDRTVGQLRQATGAGAGAAAVVGSTDDLIAPSDQIAVIRPDGDGRWVLHPWAIAFQPVQVGAADVERIAALLDAADGLPIVDDLAADRELAVVDAPSAAVLVADETLSTESSAVLLDDVWSAEGWMPEADGRDADIADPVLAVAETTDPAASTLSDPPGGGEPIDDWAFVVRLFGPIEIHTADGIPVAFGRSKSEELVVWMAEHRGRSTRSAARTALWDLDVRDATFSNVVSDARRALARAVQPPEGQEWIGRTLTEQLPLHPGVVSDAQLIERLRDRAAADPSRAVESLQEALRWIRGNPFESCTYLWPDAEGITSNLVILATGAAIQLAELALERGDVELAFWATEQGLRVLPGHEQLVAIRMRTHHAMGSLAGVRVEWESYERALRADAWSDGEPSPMLAGLRRELLSGAA